jgi:hypothetical protein
MTLLIGLAQGAEAEHRLEVERDPDELYTAPRISPLPSGLPQPQVAPEDGRWVSTEGTESWAAGVFLPMELNLELRRRARACDKLPGLFQVQLDQLKRVAAAELAQAVALAVARERVSHVRQGLEAPAIDEGGLPNWIETPLIIAGVVLAAGVGAWVGWQARRAL